MIYADIAAKKNGAAFIVKLIQVCQVLDIQPEWLLAVIRFETAGTYSPSKRNPKNGAVGLIQFVETTARGMGTTTAALASLTAVQQLDFVLKYYWTYRRFIKSPEDLYTATFYPYALITEQPDTYVIGIQKGTAHARYISSINPGLDLNKDGVISLGEFRKAMREKVFAGYLKKNEVQQAEPLA